MYNNKTITAGEIVEALYDKHPKDMCFDELRMSSGFANLSRLDFLAISVAPSTGNLSTAYEVKVSRADFRRDNHSKQRSARMISDHFYYIAPVDVIPHEEVPDWAGLIEVEWAVHKRYNKTVPYLKLVKRIPAPKRDKDSPSWGLVISMIRNERKRSIK